jgi:helicase
MKVENLSGYGIPQAFIDKFKEEGIEELYPPQEKAINNGLLEGKSLVLSVPTAAGKTLTATLAIIKKLSESPVKAIYIVPLVALANEKYNYYKALFKEKWRVAISVGDYDSADPRLSGQDLIVCTTEKLDSLIRHFAKWVGEIDLVIIDEVHLLNDTSRGPTLEILITRLKEIIPSAQILALSATVNNSDELADWLEAESIVSDFRPVKLHEGVSYGNAIKFLDKDDYEILAVEQENSILENTINLRKQALFFVSTRRNAEGLASRLTTTTKPKLTSLEKEQLKKLSEDVLAALESPTRQCKKLADCVKLGSAFHHAGLLRRQKTLVEDAFRDGLIKSISATPTLAMGVNLPAFRVIIRDAKRYYRGIGSTYIPVLEYKQFVGRAGRPQYDEFGESILVAKTESEAEELVNKFILGEPERIKSKLAVEPVLRTHTLALIASGFTRTEKELLGFFSKTFYAFQYGEMYAIEAKILEILDELESWKFITTGGDKLNPTKIGKRVSELYLDPLTAHDFVESLKSGKRRKRLFSFGLLQMISNTIEMYPPLSVRSGEFADIDETVAKKGTTLLQTIPKEWDFEYERFMRSVKTAMFFEEWTNEKTEDQLLARFKVAPGELRNRLFVADWLTYSLQELGLLIGMKDKLKDIRRLRVRLKYGVREDLIPLIRLRSVGRVRARRLYAAGFKTVASLRKAPLDTLSKLVGPKIAYNIKEQLVKDFGKKVPPPKQPARTRQSNLVKF